MKTATRLLYPAAALLCAACVSLAEKPGRALDGLTGSPWAAKILETAESRPGNFGGFSPGMTLRRALLKNGDPVLILTLKEWPALSFYLTESPGGPAGTILRPLAASFLVSAQPGWNEFTLDLSGEGSFREEGNARVMKLRRLEAADLSWGRLRRFDTRLSGTAALTALRNRRERIAALTEWMRNYEDRPAGGGGNGAKGGGPGGGFSGQEAFEEYWRPVLFPELVKAKKRPPAYAAAAGPEARWVWAEDIRWNAAYTAVLLPEELRPLRDSGALLRDWEEAPGWIYLAYRWNDIIQTITTETVFEKPGT
ncbi:MAG: hypothetical protein LBG84_10655 [Treponema sp.]|jgi:hypothetical protein|nr:hypothetical protein [Treponema sp.]